MTRLWVLLLALCANGCVIAVGTSTSTSQTAHYDGSHEVDRLLRDGRTTRHHVGWSHYTRNVDGCESSSLQIRVDYESAPDQFFIVLNGFVEHEELPRPANKTSFEYYGPIAPGRLKLQAWYYGRGWTDVVETEYEVRGKVLYFIRSHVLAR